MQRAKKEKSLSVQMKEKVSAPAPEKKPEYDGDFGTVISTGSTLLNLEISGGRVHGGGLPSRILVEVFGPNGSGKTVLLSEIAGDVQRKGGEIKFDDPEARLNKIFATMFGLNITEENYRKPDTITEVFESVRSWKPKSLKVINGYFADSLAALSTDMEMNDNDPYGMRRAKEFSEELRKTCRILSDKNYIMVCSNQEREVIGATQYQQKTNTPGGKAMGFYSSLRLKFSNPAKIKRVLPKEEEFEEADIDTKKKKKGDDKIIGISVDVDVFKNSIWKPYGSAPLVILFDYGIDNIRTNLQFVKERLKLKTYSVDGQALDNSMDTAIKMVEAEELENILTEQVIDLWEKKEQDEKINRKPKIR